MKQQHKGLMRLWTAVGAVLVFCALFLVLQVQNKPQINSALNLEPMSEQSVHVLNASYFNSELDDEKDKNLYLCRPEKVDADKYYYGSISLARINVGQSSSSLTFSRTEEDRENHAIHEVHVLKRVNDDWVEIENEETGKFHIKFAWDNMSVRWFLQEDAPAGMYGISCTYWLDSKTERESIFTILYASNYTYLQVTESGTKNLRITNFYGGEKTLELDIKYNSGAASPLLIDGNETYGAISEDDKVVSVDKNTMHVSVKPLSGDYYNSLETDFYDRNHVRLIFKEELGNDIYLVQVISEADGSVVGQFVIDNTGAKGGVNLSQLWAVLMIFGGVLALSAASAYLIPFVMMKVNEARVNKESERIDRMKNPEKYAESDEKSLKGTINKIIYNIKTPAYKRKQDKEKAEEEKLQAEKQEKSYSNRFTEMLRERQEKRDFMREHNVTSAEMEQMKEAEKIAAAEELNSFAALRDDDDDEIATFHAAEDEISTLETGSYVKDGATFAELDSERAKTDKPQNGNANDGK